MNVSILAGGRVAAASAILVSTLTGVTASGADIFVPGDAPDVLSAIAIAEPGDTISVIDSELLFDVVYTDLERKPLTIVAGTRFNTDQFIAGGYWVLPDGAALLGDSISLLGVTRIRDGAEVFLAAPNGGVSFGVQEPVPGTNLELGNSARLDIQAQFTQFDGDTLLREGATLSSVMPNAELRPAPFTQIEVRSGATLRASRLNLENGASLVAEDASIDVGNLAVEGDSLLALTGGTLSVSRIERFSATHPIVLNGADLLYSSDGNAELYPGFFINDATISSSWALDVEGVESDDVGGPAAPVFENARIEGAGIAFQSGRSFLSGEILGVLDVWSADLAITGDTDVYGAARNDGTITVLSGDLVFFGGLENNGSIIVPEGQPRGVASRTVRVLSDLTVRARQAIALAPGDRLAVRGNLTFESGVRNRGIRLAGATVELLPPPPFPGGSDDQEVVEAAPADLGASERGFDTARRDTAPFGELVVRAGVQALIADWRSNIEGPAAVYADTVRVDAGGTMSVSEDTRVYCRTLINEGTIETPERVVVIGGCEADLAAPFGVTDLADITAFVSAFGDGFPAADYAEPFGVFDLADLTAFVAAFTAPCG